MLSRILFFHDDHQQSNEKQDAYEDSGSNASSFCCATWRIDNALVPIPSVVAGGGGGGGGDRVAVARGVPPKEIGYIRAADG